MILMREKCTSSRSRDRHGLFFMIKQRICLWALNMMPASPWPVATAYNQAICGQYFCDIPHAGFLIFINNGIVLVIKA